MRRAATEAAARHLHQGPRSSWINGAKAPLAIINSTTTGTTTSSSSSRRALIASSAAPSAAAPAPSSPSPASSASSWSLTEQSPFWTLCGVLAIGISAAAVGQRAVIQDARADRAEQRNAAAEAYASARGVAEARGERLAAVEAAARRELGAGEPGAGRRRPWREVSEELWAAMSEGGRG